MTETIDVEALQEWLKQGRKVSILDVRPANERAEWSIPGSLHVDAYEALKANDANALSRVELPEGLPVVTVCARGRTSQVAAEHLRARGVEAISLLGGMKAWSLAWNTAEFLLPGSDAEVIQVRRTGKG